MIEQPDSSPRFLRLHVQRKTWFKGLTALSAIIVFAVTYALILPAMALDQNEAARKTEEAARQKCIDRHAVELVRQCSDSRAAGAAAAKIRLPLTANTATKKTKAAISKTAHAGTLTASCGFCTVRVHYTAAAKIPRGATLKVRALKTGSSRYRHYYRASKQALKTDRALSQARFFDISIYSRGGRKIEPKASVQTEIRYGSALKIGTSQKLQVVHFARKNGREKPEVLTARTTAAQRGGKKQVSAVSFRQSSFSVVGTAVEPLSKGWPSDTDQGYVMVVTGDGQNYYAVDQNGGLTPVSVRNPGTAEQQVVFDREGNKVDTLKELKRNYYWFLSQYTGEQNQHAGEYQIGNLPCTKYIQAYNGDALTSNTSWYMYRSGSGQIYHHAYSNRYYLGIDTAAMKIRRGTVTGDTAADPSISDDACSVYFVHDFTNPDDPDEEKIDDDTIDLGAPQTDKKLTPHNATAENPEGDGTYDLTLSVTGKTRSLSESGKADITIIYDNSYSMVEHKDGNGNTRLDIARDAINCMAETLLKSNDEDHPDAVRLSLVTFGNIAEKKTFGTDAADSTKSLEEFQTAVNSVTEDSIEDKFDELDKNVNGVATNWEDALEKAYSVETRDNAKHYVIFVSDGNPTVRNSAGYYYNGFGDVDDSPYHPTYAYHYTGTLSLPIYGTGSDSLPIEVHWKNGNRTGYTTVSSATNINRCYWESRDNARALVRSGTSFYSISAFGNIGNMRNLLNYAYNGSDSVSTGTPDGHYYAAADQTSLNDAFKNITNQIMVDYMYSDVHVSDEITGCTMLDAKTDDVSLNESNFTYYKYGGEKDANGNPKYGTAENPTELTEQDLKGAGLGTAQYKDGKVVWDLLGPRQTNSDGKLQWEEAKLENGVTYVVKFRVWPGQDAYDTLMKIKNAENPDDAYDKLDSSVKSQIYKDEQGVYRLRTNGKAQVSYDTVKQTLVKPDDGTSGVRLVDDNETVDLKNPEGMKLTVPKILVKKEWVDGNASDVRPDKLLFDIYQDGTMMGTVELNKEHGWKQEVYVSTGLWVSSPASENQSVNNGNVLDKGHTYTVKERKADGTTVKVDYQFTGGKIHPYLKDSPSEFYYCGSGNQAVLTGTNTVETTIWILKKSADGRQTLKGAEFALFSDAECKEPVKGSDGSPIVVTTDGQGAAKIGTLAVDKDYYLKETKAPAGYIGLGDPIRIYIDKTGKITYFLPEGSPGSGEIDNSTGGNGTGVQVLECKNVVVLEVRNPAGGELPDAGGSGTLPWILGGLLLTGAAFTADRLRRRRRAEG